MSLYTTEVRFICESYAEKSEHADRDKIDEILEIALPKIFDFDYPIFDENYRRVLEGKIIKHYYTREICEETVGLWKLRLQVKLNEIMPFYNELYKTTTLEYNPLYDVDYQVTGNKIGNENGVESSRSNASNNVENHGEQRNAFSDTPQGRISGVEENTYLTEYTKNDNDFSGNSVANNSENKDKRVNNTQNYIEHVIGKRSGTSYAKMVKEFRENLINIDMMIIKDLADLFMTLWG